MAVLRNYYTTRDLAQILGITERAVQLRAGREEWRSVPRKGRGGGRLWLVEDMPAATRDQIASSLLRRGRTHGAEEDGFSVLPAPAASCEMAPAPVVSCAANGSGGGLVPLDDRTDKERRTTIARLAFCAEIERLAPLVGKKQAIAHLVTLSRLGELNESLTACLPHALPRMRQPRLSERTLWRWCSELAGGGAAALTPRMRREAPIPAWADEFLACYQKPQHPSVVMAHEELCNAMRARGEEPPSIHACRRLLARMGTPEREAGRATGNALLRLRPYQRRDTSELWPTDAYTADGTTFDAEVLHPDHGQPFKPEITLVLDIATRRCVGISVALSESALTVLDALRMACCFGGIPALFYSDNGPGYVNAQLRDDRTGMLVRLGITPVNALPGRPQGKGLMERAVETICVRAAQELPSYTGALMDGDAAKRNFKLSRAAIRQGKRAMLPTWEEFKRHILARVEAYNAAPHGGLPRYRDAEGRLRNYSPNEYWQHFAARGFKPVNVPPDMASELFMPGVRRITRNGWLQFYSGRYFAPELAEFHGEAVEVRYDIWDAGRVWCWTADGRRICEAILEGNTRPYFERSRIEAAREKRARAQVKRLDAKLQRIAPGAEISLPPVADTVTVDISDVRQPAESVLSPVTDTPPEAATTRPVFATTYDRFRWLMEHADQRTDADRDWLAAYRQGEEYADLRELYAAQGFV